MKNNPLPQKNLYLQQGVPGDERKPVELLESGVKAIAKSQPNLAIYDKDGQPHEVLKAIMDLAQNAKYTFEYGRTAMYNEKWKQMDNFYWMEEKQSRLPELTRAKVCGSSYYRVVRRLQDGAFIATFGTDDLPVKFEPLIDPKDASDIKEIKAIKAQAVNKCAADYFQKERIKQDPTKAKRAYHQLFKYGNVIIYTPWLYETGKRYTYEDENVNEPFVEQDGRVRHRHGKTGEISDSPFPPESKVVEKEVIVKDSVGFFPLPITNVWLDDRIEDINRQTYLLWRSDITRAEIFAQAQNGNFKNVEWINEQHKWQLFGYDSYMENDLRNDAHKDSTQSLASEIYERWQCWMMLPKIEVKLNKKGEAVDLVWDQNAEPRRYLLEVVGSINQPCVAVNFRESPYWSNNVPFIMAHSHDDVSMAYHRGIFELLQDNMTQESVAKGQLMDNRTLMNYRPMTWLKGRVMAKNGNITHNTVFHVTSQDAIRQLDISDITGTIHTSLDYLRDESESIGQTPKFMMGEAAGSRTSATEIASIRDMSTSPTLADNKSINMQIFGGYMQKILEYLPQFEEDQVALALEGQEMLVDTGKIEQSDVILKEVAIQEYDNKITQRQLLLNLAQTFAGNPMFQGIINPAGFFCVLMAKYPELIDNPESLLIKSPQVQQALLEWQASWKQSENEKMLTAEEKMENAAEEPVGMNMGKMPEEAEGVQLPGPSIPGRPPLPAGSPNPYNPDGAAMAAVGGQTRGM